MLDQSNSNSNPNPNGKVRVNKLTLDVENGQIIGPDRKHKLRPMERRLLQVLLQHPNQVVSRADLMKKVWETDFLEDTRTLEVHICLLRRKIEMNPHNPRYLRTMRGVGYSFCF